MSHEIYYTSAPAGMKRGASGFCTVAAGDNMPRGLLERLEALSAYRHHFPAHSNAQNPVSEAHWLLNVSGTTYHVLSRICDSGVDHTQRTNAFAHHLVLDPADMAAAGPAWMLERPGVMARTWDGQVGAIAPRSLPRGDTSPAICRAWGAAAGDPGWGGHLADIFVKSPAKPVCILFAPGQQILPLIAESIALLPPTARWNVTFNTYFTSMPTSATCVWRCCLADTPAAVIALRYAAAGVVINLTDTSRLGQAPAGPYVTLARTGQPPAGVIRAAAAPPPAVVRPAARAAVKTPPIQKPAPEKPPEIEEEPLPEETSLYEVAAERAAENFPPVAGPSLPASNRPLVKRTITSMRQADAALRSAQTEESQAAARRRKQVMLLFAGAVGALAVGTLLVSVLLHGGGPPPESDLTGGATLPKPAPIPQPAPVVIATNPAPLIVHVATAPATQTVAVAPAPVVVPAPVYVPPPPGPRFPGVVTLNDSLSYPTPGNGIADSTQTLNFKKAELEKGGLRSVHFNFPNGKIEYPIKDSPAGAFVSSPPEKHAGTQTVTITWKDSAELDIATVTFDRAHSSVAVTWKTSAMIKRPQVVRLAYWLMQASTLELESRRGKNQQLAFKAPDITVIQLTDRGTALGTLNQLPANANVVAPTVLPPGWQATWYTQWDAKDSALKNPATASQVLKFHKPVAGGVVESWFTLTFTPQFAVVDSNFAHRVASDQADLAQAQSDLRAITADIQDRETRAGVKETDPALAPYLQKKMQASQIVDAYKAAVAGYKDITDFDVAVTLPDGLHLATVRFHHGTK